MRHTQDDLDKAVAAWLESNKAYKRFLADTEALFAIFASAWCGPRNGLIEAFESFRAALLSENGYSQSEVRDLYPRRKHEAN